MAVLSNYTTVALSVVMGLSIFLSYPLVMDRRAGIQRFLTYNAVAMEDVKKFETIERNDEKAQRRGPVRRKRTRRRSG